MNLDLFKEKLIKAKESTLKFGNGLLISGSTILQESKFTISSIDELEKFIEKSKNYFNQAMNKEVTKRVIIIFAPKQSEFYKKALYILPVLYTKAWTANIDVRMADTSIEFLDLKKYSIEKIPSLLLFENEKVEKIVAGEEKIDKIVNSLTLDILETINSQVEKDSNLKDDKKNEVVTS